MEIPQKDLDEFKAIYKKDYGEDLSDEEAQVIAGRLLSILKVVSQPLPCPGKRSNSK